MKDRWVHLGLSSLAIDVEIMLGNRQKYMCMDECRESIKEIAAVAQQQRIQLETPLQDMLRTTQPNASEEWENFLVSATVWFKRWMDLAKQELHFVEANLQKLQIIPHCYMVFLLPKMLYTSSTLHFTPQ